MKKTISTKKRLEFKKKRILSVNEIKMFCFNMVKETLISKDQLRPLEEERNISLLIFKKNTEKYYSEIKTKNKISRTDVKNTFNMLDEKNRALKKKKKRYQKNPQKIKNNIQFKIFTKIH